MAGNMDRSAHATFLSGGGEMGERIRAFDWTSSLGPPDSWPPVLQTLVSIVLGSNQAMHIAWGSELTLLYNDAYIKILGAKHPRALGSPLLKVWSEIQDQLTPLIKQLYEGKPIQIDNMGLTIERNGYAEEAFFSFSGTPIYDASGAVAGLFCPSTETTVEVLASRNLAERLVQKRRLLEQAPGFMAFLVGPEHVYEFVNVSYTKLFGERSYIGRSVREVFPDLAGQEIYNWLDHVYQTGQRFLANAITVRLQDSPGLKPEDLVLDFIYEPIMDEAEKVIGIFVEGYDVTERQRAQEALRTSEKLFSALAQTIPSHVWMARADGDIYWFNESCCQYYGAAEAELHNAGWVERVHPDDLPALRAHWAASVTTGTSYQAEKRLRRADGLYRWHLARAVPLRDEAGTILQWIGTSTDIEDQKHVAARLLQANEVLGQRVEERTAEYDRVWRNSRDLLMVLGVDGIYRAVSPAWTALLGYEPKEVVGRNYLELIWPDDKEPTQAAHEQALLGTPITGLVNRFRHKDGAVRWISWNTSMEDGRIYGYGRDITAERAQAEALRQSEEKLHQAQKMEAVGLLTSGISHDFNNLLSGITGSLELAQRRLSQGRIENIERYLSGAMSSAHRAANLVHRLLAFSRRQPIDPQVVDIKEELTGMDELLRRTIPQHSFELSVNEEVWPVRCDPSQLACSVLNLAINARDAMSEKGELRIKVENKHFDHLHADNQVDIEAGDYVAISVTDTGQGMPADIQERVLEPFFTTKPLGQGTGLGLSMVYGFAQQSDGQMKIWSEEGKGTTVTLYLPHCEAGIQEEVIEQLDLGPDLEQVVAKKTILIVEDDPVVRELLKDVLQESGYMTLCAIDGPSGLSILQSGQCVDLLITDIGLPGFDGRHMVSIASKACPDLKVLFVSAYEEHVRATDDESDGVKAQILTKPFDITELVAKVNCVLVDSTT